MTRVVGIDLGTSKSIVCVLENGRPRILANAQGAHHTPTVVGFNDDGSVIVGQKAADRAIAHPGQTAAGVRRHLGTDWTFTDHGRAYTAPQITACVLRKLKRDAQAALGEEFTDVVLSMPAHYGEAERRATEEACELAGLRVRRFVGETNLAAFAYTLHARPADETTLVLDLGAGTFSVALFEIGAGVTEVRAIGGDNALGGDDWDQRLADSIVRRFRANTGIDLSTDSHALQRIRVAAEQAKIELSSAATSTVNLPYIATDSGGNPMFLSENITRAEFAELTADLLDRCRAPIAKVLADAGLPMREVNRVVLVGGASRMPAFVALVTELSGREPYRGMHPDESAAIGAAILTGVFTGAIRDQLLLDATPISIGIATSGGKFTDLVHRHTTIATTRDAFVTTVADNQTGIDLEIFQGEHEIAKHNHLLGVLSLSPIAPARRGTPRIKVNVNIDANGRTVVTATDPASGAEESLTVIGGVEAPVPRNPFVPPTEVEMHPDQDTGTSRERKPQAESSAAGPQQTTPGRTATMPSRENPSQLITAAAAEHLLGQHVSTHPHRWFGGSPKWIYGIPLAILGVIVIASFITDGAGSALAVAILFLGVAGLVWLRQFISSPKHTAARVKYASSQSTGSQFRDAQLSLFERGAVVQSGGRTHVFRWETVSVIEDITRVSHRMYGSETGVSWTYRYQLTDPSGADYLITDRFVGAEQWGPEIRRRVTAAQLPLALAAAETGKSLEFGSITLSHGAIRAHNRSVPWGEVQEIRVDKGYIAIRVAGEWLSLTKVAANAIPNVFVFLELAERLRTLAR
ncbi:DUF6585 family protein [Nocardia sp. NPDC058058]|uniref:DUF6585 family protein n=1 Tax=Nocardia sp. NPDC058058 TaxID=3346317 RepID=UPI0036D87171